MELAIVGDSHIPSRESAIPDTFADRIAAADHVLHTGDFDSEAALAEMQELAAELTAVHGNMDPRLGLPETETVELGGVTFVLTHGTGDPDGWHDRVAEMTQSRADANAVGVGGHIHRIVDTVHDGIRLLNPGSVTGALPAEGASMITATVAEGDLTVSVHEQ
ncbi:MAG: metallophosphoesterase family protein [Salinirussus sp.]